MWLYRKGATFLQLYPFASSSTLPSWDGMMQQWRMGLLESCWWWKDLRILLTHLVLRWWLTRIVDLGVSLWRHSCTVAMFTAYSDIVYTVPSFWWMLFWNLLFKNIKIKITWAFVLITTGTPARSNSVSYYRSQRDWLTMILLHF